MIFSTGIENFLTFLSAAAGACLATRFRFTHKQLCALISFASGTLFGAAVFHIAPHALEHFSLLTTALVLFSGYALFYVITRYVSHICPACSASHFEEHEREEQPDSSLYFLAAALTLHSLLDGLAVAFGHSHGRGSSIALTVLIHKFPEGFALCALLIKAGLPKVRAAWLAVLLESSTLAGWALGTTLLTHFGWSPALDLILIHAGGGFLFLAFHAVLNEIRKHSPVLPLVSFAAGAALIYFIG